MPPALCPRGADRYRAALRVDWETFAARRKPLQQAGSPLHPVIPRVYPLYKQCNSSWGDDVMEHDTICQVGCLMSSTR